ncbi:fatty acid CoA ligase [Pusillimonas sp. T7-7]|uniref:class I adenylate-forming enzyme family protein n=1 Tax=Pusillimonas sp. (strain T7-7) TaxID=1007105 RepID=UPI0002085293|nr:AMP-binding protein [Pusillimonas sp. T7-7]AEC19036.1 fatty acid CoA ligase [Pusillimonas sp. T7-7]
MNLAQWLYSRALVNPEAPALFTGTRQCADYRQFAVQASALGAYLQQQYGIKAGDRIAVYMANRIEYLVLFYACWWVGAVVVPINYKLHPKEAAWIAQNAEASLLFTDKGNIFSAGELPDGCSEAGVDTEVLQVCKADAAGLQSPLVLDPHALAWLFYTSGTTGRPKGVMLTHENLMAMSMCYPLDVDDVSPDDASFYAAPMSHGAGLYNLVFVRIGARHVVPESRGFDGAEILDLAKKLDKLTMFAAPTMVKRLVAEARKSGSQGEGIKSIIFGGGPMYSADLIEALDVLGPKFVQIYGQGESPMTISSVPRAIINDRAHPDWSMRLGSAGFAQSCIELRVVDADMNDVPVGVCGEVIARGPAVTQGYWRNPQATAETIVDGWLHTGDIGHLSADGFLTLTDRSKDVIISGGTNIYPREVEEVLARHPKVFEVAVVGAPHAEWGEEVVAFIVSNDGQKIDAAELDAWCKSEMASFKKPKRYVFRAEMPKNSYGKIPKTGLREEAKALAGGVSTSAE